MFVLNLTFLRPVVILDACSFRQIARKNERSDSDRFVMTFNVGEHQQGEPVPVDTSSKCRLYFLAVGGKNGHKIFNKRLVTGAVKATAINGFNANNKKSVG